MITLGIYSSDGSSLLGQVSCFGADNGSMFIPSQYLNYPTWSLVAIHIERFEIDIVDVRPAEENEIEHGHAHGPHGHHH